MLTRLRMICTVLCFISMPLDAHAGCFLNCLPTNEDVQAVFEDTIRTKLGSDPYEILKVQRTSASDHRVLGRTFYFVQIAVELRFPRGVRAACDYNSQQSPPITECQWRFFVAAPNHPPQFAGISLTLTSVVVFERTAEGWRAFNGKLYAAPFKFTDMRSLHLARAVYLLLIQGTIFGRLGWLSR